jgi:hypothetical protein
VTVAGPNVDGRSFGGFLTHRIVCAVKGGCDDGAAALAGTYGTRDATLLRRHAPDLVYEPGEAQLPVDWRECRARRCADAPDDRDLDAHRSHSGRRATLFTRVVRRGGRTYLQYWLYYPDSNSTVAGSDKLWRGITRTRLGRGILGGKAPYPGFHRDDWEGYQVRVDRDGRVAVRSTSHGHYQHCKHAQCHNRWGPPTGWTRVSRGSHAGHIPLRSQVRGLRLGGRLPPFGLRRPILTHRHRPSLPGRDLRERTTTSEGLRLVPLESMDRRRYRRLRKSIRPPWRKRVYRHPEDNES